MSDVVTEPSRSSVPRARTHSTQLFLEHTVPIIINVYYIKIYIAKYMTTSHIIERHLTPKKGRMKFNEEEDDVMCVVHLIK